MRYLEESNAYIQTESRTEVASGGRSGEWGGSLVSVLQDEKSWAVNDADSCTALRVYLTPMHCTRKNGQDGKFHGMCILPEPFLN